MKHKKISVNITHMEKKSVNKNCSWSSNVRFTKDSKSSITDVLKELKNAWEQCLTKHVISIKI